MRSFKSNENIHKKEGGSYYVKLLMSQVMRKSAFANNKGADQLAHLRSLISTFVVRGLDRIIPLVSISEISSLYLASLAKQSSLSLTWSQTPKTGFLMTALSLSVAFPRHQFQRTFSR